jgi:hypothetical protein
MTHAADITIYATPSTGNVWDTLKWEPLATWRVENSRPLASLKYGDEPLGETLLEDAVSNCLRMALAEFPQASRVQASVTQTDDRFCCCDCHRLR